MTDVIDRAAARQPVATIMSTRLAAVEQHDSVREVAKELTADEIGAVLVDSPLGTVGIVSERDVVTMVAIGSDLEQEQVRAVMSVDILAVESTETIAAVARLMIDGGVRHIAVRRDGRIVGIVSMRDVLDALLDGE
jgi:predicted transcriptional regulator